MDATTNRPAAPAILTEGALYHLATASKVAFKAADDGKVIIGFRCLDEDGEPLLAYITVNGTVDSVRAAVVAADPTVRLQN